MIGKQYEYDAMAECEKELWWYRRLHDQTMEVVREVAGKDAAILDAGCGTGGMLVRLQNEGYTNLSGFDFSADAINYCISKGFPNVQLLDILESDTAYPAGSFDLIINNDILCLLNEGDDKLAFHKLVSLLKPGGTLVINLPSGRFFRGTHDHTLGVQRRYSRKGISDLIGKSDVQFTTYNWPVVLSPLIFSLRLFQRGRLLFDKKTDYKSDVSLPHPVLNNLFYKITSIEDPLRSLSLGSSIFVTIKKQ